MTAATTRPQLQRKIGESERCNPLSRADSVARGIIVVRSLVVKSQRLNLDVKGAAVPRQAVSREEHQGNISVEAKLCL